MTTQPAPCITNRIPLWGLVLALASTEDLLLTIIGLSGARNGVELNPIAAIALTHGFLAAALLKLASLTVALSLAVMLTRVGYARRAERMLAFWSIAYLALNAYSTIQLVGGSP